MKSALLIIFVFLFLILFIGCAAEYGNLNREPPYTRDELREAVSMVGLVFVIEQENRAVRDFGIPLCDMANLVTPCTIIVPGRIQDYCGRGRVIACTVQVGEQSEPWLYFATNASWDAIWHELGHVRDVYIEGRSWEDTRLHRGWPLKRFPIPAGF